MSLIWERPVPKRRRTVPLDRDLIVATAMALADSDGLEAVTLRRVAGELGVLPMRLYTYLQTKEDLLDLMVDAVYATIQPPAPKTPWPDALKTVAHGLRDATSRHPWFVRLLGERPPYGPHGLRLVETVWSTLSGLDPNLATTAANTAAFIGYITGALQQEHGTTNDERVQRYLAKAVGDGALPTLAEVFAELQPQDTFDSGLDVVLQGIATTLSRPA